MKDQVAFESELARIINSLSMENGSNTPDFILATFLTESLMAFNKALRAREEWYGKTSSIGGGKQPSELALHVAARVWCDQDMRSIVMDHDAAVQIAEIIDGVIERQRQPAQSIPAPDHGDQPGKAD